MIIGARLLDAIGKAAEDLEDNPELAAAGYLNERGKAFNPKSVASMLA